MWSTSASVADRGVRLVGLNDRGEGINQTVRTASGRRSHRFFRASRRDIRPTRPQRRREDYHVGMLGRITTSRYGSTVHHGYRSYHGTATVVPSVGRTAADRVPARLLHGKRDDPAYQRLPWSGTSGRDRGSVGPGRTAQHPIPSALHRTKTSAVLGPGRIASACGGLVG